MDILITSTGVPLQAAARQADVDWGARAEAWARWSLSLDEDPEPGWTRGLVWRLLTRGALVPLGPEMEEALHVRFASRTAAACAVFHRVQVACALAVPGGVPEKVTTDLSRMGDFTLEESEWLAESARRDVARLWDEISRLYPDEGAQRAEEPLFVSWMGVGRGGWRTAIVNDAVVDGSQEPAFSSERVPFHRDDAVLSSLAERLLHVGSLRAGQAEGVAALLSGRDLALTLPTGGGKSLCYQLAALLARGTPIVAAPLRALLRDQARRLRSVGVTRIGLLVGDDAVETRRGLRGLREGNSLLTFAAPERLDCASFRDALRAAAETGGVPFVVVDEAHCAARRGHDWRPAYRALGARLRMWASCSGEAPALAALSGGATAGARAEAERVLGLREPVRVDHGSARDNLSFRVWRSAAPDHLVRLRELLTRILPAGRLGPGIVFCPRVDGPLGAASVAEELVWSEGLDVAAFTGRAPSGQDPAVWDAGKRRAAEDFLSGRRGLLCATRAFGLGVDRADVRFTVHLGLPASLEEFYQQAGRAGRDGREAACWMILQVSSERRARRWAAMPVESLREELSRLYRDEQDDISRAYSMHLASFPGEEVERRDAGLVLSLIGEGKSFVELPGQDEDAFTRALVRLEETGVIVLEERRAKGWTVRRTGDWSAKTAREAIFDRVARDYRAVEPARRASLAELVELSLSSDPGRTLASRLAEKRRAPPPSKGDGALCVARR